MQLWLQNWFERVRLWDDGSFWLLVFIHKITSLGSSIFMEITHTDFIAPFYTMLWKTSWLRPMQFAN